MRLEPTKIDLDRHADHLPSHRGRRSFFSSSVGDTFTFFYVVQVSRLGVESHSSNVSFKTVARASLQKHIYLAPPGSSGNETKRVGQRAGVGSDAPKVPSFRRWEGVRKITLGWVIDRSFTLPDSSIDDTLTVFDGFSGIIVYETESWLPGLRS